MFGRKYRVVSVDNGIIVLSEKPLFGKWRNVEYRGGCTVWYTWPDCTSVRSYGKIDVLLSLWKQKRGGLWANGVDRFPQNHQTDGPS